MLVFLFIMVLFVDSITLLCEYVFIGDYMLSDLLKTKRTKDKITLAQMSKIVDFNSSYLSDIENGRRVPKSGATLKRLSFGYDIPFDKLIEVIAEHIKSEAVENSDRKIASLRSELEDK